MSFIYRALSSDFDFVEKNMCLLILLAWISVSYVSTIRFILSLLTDTCSNDSFEGAKEGFGMMIRSRLCGCDKVCNKPS